MALATTFGALLSRDNGAHWGWICEESLHIPTGTPTNPIFLWLANGDVWVATGTNLLVSHDAGCTWIPQADFVNASPGVLVADPTDAATFYVINAGVAGSDVLRSRDSGATFANILHQDSVVLTSLRPSPSRPSRLYAAGWRSASARFALLRSDDDGTTWAIQDILPSSPSTVGVLGVDPVDPNTVFHTVGDFSTGSTRLWRSTDGGISLGTAVLQVAEGINHMVFDATGQQLWVATDSFLFYSANGGLDFARRMQPSASACIGQKEGTLFTCGHGTYDGWSVARSDDGGVSWQALLRFPEVAGVLACPAGTPTFERCTPRWAQVAKTVGAETPPNIDMPIATSDQGCRCNATGADGSILALLAVALAHRRRRRAEPASSRR